MVQYMAKIGRNEQCPCGSGKKYKNCCLIKERYSKNLPDDALKQLKEEFSKYNQEDLIKTLAALSICPENQSQQIRLEIATQIACSNINCEDKIITIPELNELFLKYLPSRGPIGLLDDPLDNLFTHNILFFKNHVIFTGHCTFEYYILQKIINSIQFNSSSFSDKYRDHFFQNSMFILSLSDYIAKKTGHERYELFNDEYRQEIYFPDINELDNLKKSVTFNIKELENFKASLNINEDIGNDFIIEVGDNSFNSFLSIEKELKEHGILKDIIAKKNPYSKFAQQNPLLTSPLIKIENSYIIFPTLLSISLRHHILSSIMKFNEKENFIKNYQNTLWHDILFNLENRLSFEEFDYELPEWENTIFKDEVFKIDTDKLAYCILINDNLKNYSDEPWEIDLKYNKKLRSRIDSVIDDLLNSDELINDILIVLFVGQSGRQINNLEIPNYKNLLSITCEEFDVMANSGNYDILTLFKFASLLENTDNKEISFLDNFSIYLENNHSFPVNNKGTYEMLLAEPEDIKKLRKKAIKDKDPHLERYGKKLLLAYKISEFMYVAWHNLFLIKLNNQNIWIKCENDSESNIAKSIGYWIWQFSDELKIDLNPLNDGPIFISISVEEYTNLDTNMEITPEIKENLISSSYTSENEINFKISKNLIHIANQKNNEADRLLMNEILKLMGILLEKNSLKNTFTEKRRYEIIDENAPLGLKKHILIYDLYDINNIPVKTQIRSLQEHNLQLITYDLANKFQCEFDPDIKLTKKQSRELSHRIVDYLLDCIKNEIAKYNWEHLIQKLILNYENILFAKSFTSSKNIYYLNSYDTHSIILKDIVDENQELDKMTLPTSVLIEILSAEQNFNSSMKISNESFDNLMALSFNYIEWALGSDYIHYEYVDFDIIPLESGRFEAETNLFNVLNTFRTNRTLEHMNNLSTNIFHEKGNGENPSDEENEAFKSEFGISLTDYGSFISVLIGLARDDEKDIVFISKSKLVNKLKDELEWEPNKSLQAIENFSLTHRENWDTPPEGFDENDIKPWVFRRPLSYYLKPLIIKNDADETVIYGFRNVYHSCSNLLHLIYKGLYKTDDNTSREFKSFKSKMIDTKGKEFNERVFKWFDDELDSSEFYLDSNVKIDNKVKSDHNYGDIDVLILDYNKKHLFSIECKDIESAKNPRQIKQEIQNFLTKKKNWIDKHQRREEWIKNNLDKLGTKLNHDLTDYKVFSIFIVSQELPIIYLKETPIDLIPFSRIKNEGITFLDKYN